MKMCITLCYLKNKLYAMTVVSQRSQASSEFLSHILFFILQREMAFRNINLLDFCNIALTALDSSLSTAYNVFFI
jgi:hypothetical protein